MTEPIYFQQKFMKLEPCHIIGQTIFSASINTKVCSLFLCPVFQPFWSEKSWFEKKIHLWLICPVLKTLCRKPNKVFYFWRSFFSLIAALQHVWGFTLCPGTRWVPPGGPTTKWTSAIISLLNMTEFLQGQNLLTICHKMCKKCRWEARARDRARSAVTLASLVS